MSDAKFVYVVTQGIYSDYHISAIFSEKEAAERFVHSKTAEGRWGPRLVGQGLSLFSPTAAEQAQLEEWHPEIRIEEWALDNIDNQHTFYNVLMCKSGDVIEVGGACYSPSCGMEPWHQCTHKEGIMTLGVWARDKEHAIKIANERRTMLVATERWPEEAS